jgi:Na+-transporting methylmalonyl-CoA/oxaloacetate decarboxylase gamma subunit
MYFSYYQMQSIVFVHLFLLIVLVVLMNILLSSHCNCKEAEQSLRVIEVNIKRSLFIGFFMC